jgi:anti-sigma regulatory factor (Ser/Thr protein kinase)
MSSLVVMLHPTYDAVREAQDTVADFCLTAGLHAIRDVAVLLTSEVVTNVVLHARTDFELRVALRDEGLCVEVCDLDPNPPVPRDAAPDEPSGRGLGLLAALAGRWGHREAAYGGGKSVWFEIPV